MDSFCFETIIGTIEILTDNETVYGLNILKTNSEIKKNPSLFEQKVKEEISEYLTGQRKQFSIKVNIDGSAFTVDILKAMMTLPYGSTVSYETLAEIAGHPKACRAAGSVCRKNKIPIIIPCHRVISKDGLGGYSLGTDLKIKLHKIESIAINKPNLK